MGRVPNKIVASADNPVNIYKLIPHNKLYVVLAIYIMLYFMDNHVSILPMQRTNGLGWQP